MCKNCSNSLQKKIDYVSTLLKKIKENVCFRIERNIVESSNVVNCQSTDKRNNVKTGVGLLCKLTPILLCSFLLTIVCIINHQFHDWEAIYDQLHCVKSVQIRSFFWSVFFCIPIEYVWIWLSPNTKKYRPEKTPYLDNFHAVLGRCFWFPQKLGFLRTSQ